MKTSKKLVITTVCKKKGKIVCGRSITLATIQIFFFFGNTIAEFPFFSLLSPTFSQNFGNGVAEIRFSPHFPK